VFASTAIFVSIYSRADHQIAVISVTRSVPQGQKIAANDLGVANVVVSGSVSPVPISEARDIVGKVAAVALVPGSLLTNADISSSQSLAAGDAVVGIALKDGQLPSSGVEPGDQVMVVQTETPGTPAPAASTTATDGTGPATGVLVPSARVYAVASPAPSSSGSTSELVSIDVSSTVAAQVSVAAAADQVSLVLLPRGASGS
jgi:hypothetical protein